MSSDIKQGRYVLYDNLKYFLMLLVVIGHFLEPLTDPAKPGNHVWKLIFLLIYIVHMPLFIFVSGLFQKQYKKGRSLNVNKVIAFIVIGYLYKILNFFRDCLLTEHASFHLFSDDSLPWFMFAMAFFMLIMYFLRNVKPLVLFPASVLLACIAGYSTHINDVLYLSRTIVFFPFYALGYYLTPNMVVHFTKKKSVKVIFSTGLILIAVLCIWKFKTMYGLRHLFTGRNPYNDWDRSHAAPLLRIFCYVLTLIMGVAAISWTPDIHLPVFTKAGRYTLRIYFWHYFFIRILYCAGVITWINHLGKIQYPILLAAAILISLLTTLPVFAIPTDYILKYNFRFYKLHTKK